MHEYTVRVIHEERMERYGREADAARLAEVARRARRGRRSRPGIRVWLDNILGQWSRGGRDDAPADRLSRGLGSSAHTQLGEDV